MTTSDTPVLAIRDIEVVYESIILGLRAVSLEVPPGTVVALLGGNGAGKTTTLKAASGLLVAERGVVTRGTVAYLGQSILASPSRDLVRAGLVQVLEGRHCFPHLTVEQNLICGALIRGWNRSETRRRLERIYTWFPRLKEKRRTLAGYASGGEQQMTALGRALITEPKLVLIDEPSMGLAPLVVEEIFDIVRTLNRRDGVSFLLAEQNATLALRYADFGYVLENGRVAISGPAAELCSRDDVKELYLGVGGDRLASSRLSRARRRRPAA